jgi:hypothetical protein
VLTNYPGTGVSYPGGIAVGSDSALWFTNPGNSSIGRITTSGLVSNYTDPGITGPNEIAAGPDGALWFTNYYSGNSIGRITTSGKVTNVYTDPTINLPNGITAGPDGAMWFYNSGTNSIGRITTTTNSPQPLRINPYSESVASPGVPYHLQFSASGGRLPLHWSISKGVLPEGLTLDRVTGEISGRPTTSALIGVTVKVTDSSRPEPQTATVRVLVSVDYQFEVFAVPIRTVVRQAVSGVVAHMSYRLNGLPPIAASRLRSTIHWGDGTSSAGIVKLVGPPMAGYASYSVTPASPHMYSHVAVTSPLTSSVSVVESRASVAASESEVLVYPKHPSGKFLVNPSNPPNNGLALLMPEEPLPGQSRIDKYVWTFLDDYNKVTDNASTQPIYRDLLGKLLASPGDLGLQGEAIALGILPTDALGALNSDQIKQIANVWESYFPHHIVPHYFDVGTGRVGIQLEVSYKKSSKSHVSTTQQKVTIGTPGCLPWGGAASKWFGGFTTCDTINGIESVIGPKRTPDYVALGLSAGSAQRGIGLSSGMSLVVTSGILDPSSKCKSVYLELTFDGSVGISAPYAGSFAKGWVGPPALGQSAPSSCHIAGFVNGKTLAAGFNIGVGFAAVLSPKGDTNFNAGFEETLKLSAGGSFVVACSIPLSFGRDSVNELESAFMSLSTGSLVPSLGSANALLDAVLKNPGAIARAVQSDLYSC